MSKKNLIKFSISLYILLIPTLLFSYSIEFDKAMELAIKNNKKLQADRLAVDKSKQDLQEAKGYELGKLNFKHTLSNTNQAGHIFGMKLSSREATFADFGFDQFLTSDAMIKIMNNKIFVSFARKN